MINPDSFYSDKITISPIGITFLLGLGILIITFIIFRNKIAVKPRLYIALLLTLLVGFAVGIAVDEYALAKNGSLTNYRREKLPESKILYDTCNNC